MAYFWIDRAQTYLQSLGFDDIVHQPFHLKVGQYGGDNSYQTDKPYRIQLGKGGVDDAEGEPPPEPWRRRKLPSTSTPTRSATAPIQRPGPGEPRGAVGSGGRGSAYGAGST